VVGPRRPTPNDDDLEVVWNGRDSLSTITRSARPAAGSVRPAAEATVKARDAAILARLRIAPASLPALVAVMPDEPGLSDDDRRVACQSALIRLHVKKLIRSVEDGWAIAS